MYNRLAKRRRQLKRNYSGLIILLTLIVSLVYIVKNVSGSKNTKVTAVNIAITPTPTSIQTSSLIGKIIQEELKDTKGSYGVVVKNLKTGEVFSQNEHLQFESGSLYKLWLMGLIFEKIKNKDLGEDDILEEEVSVLNKEFGIDPENAEKTEGTVSYSIYDLTSRMITISDNYAALLLTKTVKRSAISDYIKRQGFRETKVGTNEIPPVTTPSDVALFFEKLYNFKLTTREYSHKMLTLLKQQRLNDKIPKLLPEGTEIAHKTGELDYYTHDGGIVYSPKGDFIIVILTKSDFPAVANERISSISKAVFDYLTHP